MRDGTGDGHTHNVVQARSVGPGLSLNGALGAE